MAVNGAHKLPGVRMLVNDCPICPASQNRDAGQLTAMFPYREKTITIKNTFAFKDYVCL